MANYAVVRTDNMAGTDVRSMLVSVKYFDDHLEPAAIENGSIVQLDGLLDGEREIHRGHAFSGAPDVMTSARDCLVLIASPELWYDERYRGLENFINEADRICRGYRLHSGDFFSVTAEAFIREFGQTADPEVGNCVYVVAGDTKLLYSADAPRDGVIIGRVHAIETAGKYTFYVINVI